MVSIWNRSQTDYVLQPGEKMAQYLVVPIVRPTFEIVAEFSDISVRGEGGFGSTGTH
jgi:dUTP pyrophosphatase